MLSMSIVQGIGDLFHIRHNFSECELGTFRIKLAESAIDGTSHHKVWQTPLNPKVPDANNIRMLQVGNSASLVQKLLPVVAGKPCAQYFDRGLSFEMNMLAQVNISEPSLP